MALASAAVYVYGRSFSVKRFATTNTSVSRPRPTNRTVWSLATSTRWGALVYAIGISTSSGRGMVTSVFVQGRTCRIRAVACSKRRWLKAP